MRKLLVLALLTACAVQQAPPHPFPVLPDTIYTASGATPVVVVDSIIGPDSTQLVIGRYMYFERRVLVWRGLKDERVRRKVMEHERCHVVLLESGLHNHFREVPWMVELLCDAFASARLAELERERP